MPPLEALLRLRPARHAGRRFPELRRRLAALDAAARGRLPHGLKWRLTLAAAGVAGLVILLTSLTLSRTASALAAGAAEQRAGELASCFADVVAEAVAARDRMQVQLVAAAFQRHGVDAITVVDAAGRVLHGKEEDAAIAAAPLAGAGEPAGGAAVERCRREDRELLRAWQEARFGGAQVGAVSLLLDPSALATSLEGASLAVHVIVSLGFMAMTALGLVLLHSPFLALRKLTIAAQRIGAGDLEVRVPVRGGDEVATLCAMFNSMVERLGQARQETVGKQLETIHAMINAVEAKDPYTAGHCVRVSNYAREILERQGKQEPLQAFLMQTAALLHDLGKLGIPDRILLKTERLAPDEVKVIQSHVTVGAEILSHMDSMKDVARWIRHHHERWDGQGYPDGLHGEAIPFPSRVIAVADALDAMLTDRPYRRALSRKAACAALREGRGTQFDPAVVDLAVACVEPEEHESLDDAGARGDGRLEPSLQLA